MGGDHVGLAGEDHAGGGRRERQLLGADAVEGEEHALLVPVQHRQGEVAVDVLGGVAAMLLPEGEQGGGGCLLLQGRVRETRPSGDEGGDGTFDGRRQVAGQAPVRVGLGMGGAGDTARGQHLLQDFGGVGGVVAEPAGEAVHGGLRVVQGLRAGSGGGGIRGVFG